MRRRARATQPANRAPRDHGRGLYRAILEGGHTTHPRDLVVSHITSPTAVTFPVAELCRRARGQGIYTIIDGAHAPGQRSLDLESVGADFYTGNCHKWMMGPKGSAFVYVRKQLQHMIEPLIVGHGWRPDYVSDRPLIEYVEQFGTRDLAAFLAVPAAIDYMQAHGWDEVRMRCHRLASETRKRIEEHFDVESIYPDSFEWYSQLAAIRLPDRINIPALGRILHGQYHIEMPLIHWHGFKVARLSVQSYTTQEDLDTLVDAITKHAPECMA